MRLLLWKGEAMHTVTEEGEVRSVGAAQNLQTSFLIEAVLVFLLAALVVACSLYLGGMTRGGWICVGTCAILGLVLLRMSIAPIHIRHFFGRGARRKDGRAIVHAHH
jgi:hypothetical protein